MTPEQWRKGPKKKPAGANCEPLGNSTNQQGLLKYVVQLHVSSNEAYMPIKYIYTAMLVDRGRSYEAEF
jgi:hypothetical protein